MSPTHTAIVGGGIAGLAAAWQLHQLGRSFTLYEASGRLGGPIETLHRDGFTIDMGPDGWVSEKPWAAELARELGLGDELIGSNDRTRITWIVRDGALVAIPDGMRMMVPTDLRTLAGSSLFTPEALASYAAEPGRAADLRAQAPDRDESIGSFIERHFGREVLARLAAPLLSGVFGGDVNTLSVRAVMPQFVAFEREHGSLILGLTRKLEQAATARAGRPAQPIFTTLRSGTQTLVDRMAATLPAGSVVLDAAVREVVPDGAGWRVSDARSASGWSACDHLVLATPAETTRKLLRTALPAHGDALPGLLPARSSSAILVAFAYDRHFGLPQGFGFLAPAGESAILAATFSDQKYGGRAPAGYRLLRAFFGGAAEQPDLSGNDSRSDAELTSVAAAELRRILEGSGYSLPDEPAFSVVRRWPRSLPQYAVGHIARIDELQNLLAATPTLHLLGNPYRGVGLPDLIRDARSTARTIDRG